MAITFKIYHGYKIYNDGRIVSSRNNFKSEFLKPWISWRGYKMVTLTIDGNRKHRPIHQLVLELFVSERKNNMQCRHLDGDKLNNHFSNLKWGTYLENLEDRKKHGTFQAKESHSMSKLTQLQVNKIRASTKPNKYWALKYNVSKENISSIRLWKTWK